MMNMDAQSVLDRALTQSLKACGTELGNIQIMNWHAGCLEIKAQRGFRDEFLHYFQRVDFGDSSACARALRNRKSVIIEDITLDPEFRPCCAVLQRAGVRAVQSTPLVSRRGAFVGVVSTHFPVSHRPTEIQMRGVAEVAQSVADAMIWFRAEIDAPVSEAILNSLKSLNEARAAIGRAEVVLKRGRQLFA
jgi:GAF domain-containing protein